MNLPIKFPGVGWEVGLHSKEVRLQPIGPIKYSALVMSKLVKE